MRIMYALQESNPFVWQALADGEFMVAKKDVPFTSIGVDHAREQEKKLLKKGSETFLDKRAMKIL